AACLISSVPPETSFRNRLKRRKNPRSRQGVSTMVRTGFSIVLFRPGLTNANGWARDAREPRYSLRTTNARHAKGASGGCQEEIRLRFGKSKFQIWKLQ